MYLNQFVLAIPLEGALGVARNAPESYHGINWEEVLFWPCCLLLCFALLLNDCLVVCLFIKGVQRLQLYASFLDLIGYLRHELVRVVFLAGSGKFLEECLQEPFASACIPYRVKQIQYNVIMVMEFLQLPAISSFSWAEGGDASNHLSDQELKGVDLVLWWAVVEGRVTIPVEGMEGK
jgi:hypothetical protein